VINPSHMSSSPSCASSYACQYYSYCSDDPQCATGALCPTVDCGTDFSTVSNYADRGLIDGQRHCGMLYANDPTYDKCGEAVIGGVSDDKWWDFIAQHPTSLQYKPSVITYAEMCPQTCHGLSPCSYAGITWPAPTPCRSDVVGIVPGHSSTSRNTCTMLAAKGLCSYAGSSCPETCGGNYCTDGSSTFDPNQACPVGAQCRLLPGKIFYANGNPVSFWTVVDQASAAFTVEASGSGVTTYGAVTLGVKCLHGGVDTAYDCYQPANSAQAENAACLFGSFCVHKRGGTLGPCCPDSGGACVGPTHAGWGDGNCASGWSRPMSYMTSTTNIRNSMCTISGFTGYISCGPSQTCKGPSPDFFECSV
jgi:hypothetical protein